MPWAPRYLPWGRCRSARSERARPVRQRRPKDQPLRRRLRASRPASPALFPSECGTRSLHDRGSRRKKRTATGCWTRKRKRWGGAWENVVYRLLTEFNPIRESISSARVRAERTDDWPQDRRLSQNAPGLRGATLVAQENAIRPQKYGGEILSIFGRPCTFTKVRWASEHRW